ncbi:restriction endonuclease subunit S, partial [Salmonella enterica subsp. enterica serovar Alachua]|nr:restriction endonuclease subunit S [Salmonella enterica subsp. enterica serovar Alachua]
MTEQQLPEGWQMVKFGDIAKHISKRVEPSETDLEIYVGLEHLDPDSLKIKRHGTPSDVEGQKLLVKKGQIIFGKRRAYQRKVAVADWDCICSAHAMVLEANPKYVIPDFLPYFMQSSTFMDRAVAISEGSLSPTIKWKVLASQTFILPPKNIQFAIVSKLLAALEVSKKNEELSASAERLYFSLLNKVYN